MATLNEARNPACASRSLPLDTRELILDAISQRLRISVQLHGDSVEVETLINIRAAPTRPVIKDVLNFEDPRIYGVSELSAIGEHLRILEVISREWFSAMTDSRVRPSTVLDTGRLLPIRVEAVETTGKRQQT